MDNGSSIYLNDVSLPFCDRLNIKPYPDLVISSLPATSSSEPNSTESTSLWSSCGTMVTLTKLIAHPSWATERAVFQGGSVRRVNLVGWSRKLLLFHYCSSCYCLRARDIVSVHCSPASCIMQIWSLRGFSMLTQGYLTPSPICKVFHSRTTDYKTFVQQNCAFLIEDGFSCTLVS